MEVQWRAGPECSKQYYALLDLVQLPTPPFECMMMIKQRNPVFSSLNVSICCRLVLTRRISDVVSLGENDPLTGIRACKPRRCFGFEVLTASTADLADFAPNLLNFIITVLTPPDHRRVSPSPRKRRKKYNSHGAYVIIPPTCKFSFLLFEGTYQNTSPSGTF